MKRLLTGFVLCMLALPFAEATVASNYLKQPDKWFKSEEGRRIADNVITWQTPHGSWPKNRDTAEEPYRGDPDKLNGTFDNGATTGELRFLARAFSATDEQRYHDAFLKGFDHILKAQYPTGGWPQYYPPGDGYNRHITFNDNSMVRILQFLKEVSESPEYGFLDEERRDAAETAFDKGIQCILDCQIIVDGKRTAWCAQHDAVDLRPRPARSYELESLSGGESASILKLLMSLENPSNKVKQAIEAGVAWFKSSAVHGIRLERPEGGDRVAVNDPDAPPLWARFYEIETNRPFFCDRDGVKKYSYNEIKAERRNGYSWYGDWGEDVIRQYEDWKE